MRRNHLLIPGLLPLLLLAGAVWADPPTPDRVMEERARCGAGSAPAAAWHHLLLSRDLEASGDRARAREQVRLAARLDPELLDAHTSMVRLGIPGDPGLAADGIAGASAILARNYLFQRRMLAAFLPALWIALLIAAAVAWAFMAARCLPRAHHIIEEGIAQRRGPRPSLVAAGVLAVPLLIPWGLVSCAAFYVGLAVREMKRKEKAVALTGVVCVLVSPLLWSWLTPWSAPIDLREPSWLLDRAQREMPTPELHHLVAEASPGQDAALAFAEGMILRREGRLGEAAIAFERAESWLGPAGAQAGVNLANVDFWRGDATAAARRYEALLDRESVGLEARYNLAVALSRLHRFNEADARLEEAARLDLDRVRSAGRPGDPHATHDVMDGLIPTTGLWSIQRSAAPASSAPLPAWSALLFPGGKFRTLPLGLIGALLAGALAGAVLRRRLRVHLCHHCGAPVCRRCVARTAGRAYCRRCAASLGRVAPTDQGRILLRRWTGQDSSSAERTKAWVFNLLPGAGLIARGSPVAGSLLLVLFTCGFLLFSRAVWPFFPCPTTSGVEGVLRVGGAIVLIVSWTLSVELSRREAHRRDLRTFFERDAYRAAA